MVNWCQYFLMRLVEESEKEKSAKDTGKFLKYVAYGTKLSYLVEIMKSLGKGKKLPSSKIMLKTNYAKVQKKAQKKRKIKNETLRVQLRHLSL